MLVLQTRVAYQILVNDGMDFASEHHIIHCILLVFYTIFTLFEVIDMGTGMTFYLQDPCNLLDFGMIMMVPRECSCFQKDRQLVTAQ